MQADIYSRDTVTRIEGPLLFLKRTINAGLNEAVVVGLGVVVGVSVTVGVMVGVGVDVAVGVDVGVGEAVGVELGVAVAVGVPVGVDVGVGVGCVRAFDGTQLGAPMPHINVPLLLLSESSLTVMTTPSDIL